MIIGTATKDKKLAEKYTDFHSMPWADGGRKTAFRGQLIDVPYSNLDSAVVLEDGSRVYFDENQGYMIRAYAPSEMTAVTLTEHAEALELTKAFTRKKEDDCVSSYGGNPEIRRLFIEQYHARNLGEISTEEAPGVKVDTWVPGSGRVEAYVTDTGTVTFIANWYGVRKLITVPSIVNSTCSKTGPAQLDIEG